MYLLHAINSDRQQNCLMFSDRLQYILGGGKKLVVSTSDEVQLIRHCTKDILDFLL